MIFERAFADLYGFEGDYSDDKADSGGATRFGITEAAARAHGYAGPMKALPYGTARVIYKQSYWDKLRLDDVTELSKPIALELFDTGVNCGTGVAAEFLQRALNVFNNKQSYYSDVMVDGNLGQATIDALRAFLLMRAGSGERVMLRALNALQGARYVHLAEAREKDERFIYGWFLQRVRI